MLSKIYGLWRSLIVWWVWWLLLAAFWWMMHAGILWEDGSKIEKAWQTSLSTSCHFIGISVTAMRLTTTTTSGIHCHKFKIHVCLIGGSVSYFLLFYPSNRLMHFWFYDNLSTVGYIGRECLCYLSFVVSWRGNLLTIYALGDRRGLWVSSFQAPFVCWWLNQGMQEDIIIGGGFSLQKLPINSTSAYLNAENR